MTTETTATERKRPAPTTTYGIGSVGDLWVGDRPDEKLAQALQVIATLLHPSFDKGWMNPTAYIPPDHSKKSCILASAAVRDFLFRIGYRDAQMLSVRFWIDAKDENEELVKALNIGDPDVAELPDRYNGHVVVTVEDWVIDTTLYQATPREAWPNFPPMFATRRLGPDSKAEWFGHKVLAAGGIIEATTGHHIQWGWLDYTAETDWRTAPDFREKWRRERVVDTMVAAFRAGSA